MKNKQHPACSAGDFRRGRRGGFTLLELIVATAILGIAIVGLLTLVTVSLSNAAQVSRYDHAAMLARGKMNELLAVHPLPLGQGLGGTFDRDSGWEAQVSPLESASPGGAGDLIVQIRLTIWWIENERRRSLDFDGYRTLAMQEEYEALRDRLP